MIINTYFIGHGINEAGVGVGYTTFTIDNKEVKSIKNCKELKGEVTKYTRDIRKNLHCLDYIKIDFINSLVVCDFLKEDFNKFCKIHEIFFNKYNLFIVRKEFKNNFK